MSRCQAVLALLLVGCAIAHCQTPESDPDAGSDDTDLVITTIREGRMLVGTPTGLTVTPTPNIKAPNGSRFTGSLNSDASRRPEVQGLFEVLAQPSDVVGVHVIHVPGTNKFLYMERPSEKRSRTRQIAGTFDLVTREWVPVNASDGLFCAGHSVTSEGEVVVVGGHKATGGFADGMRSVRIFDLTTGPRLLVNATWMQWKRWYPSVTLLPDAQLLIMGGTQQVGGSSGGNVNYELYKANTAPTQYPLQTFQVEQTFFRHMKKMYYPFNFVLPTGDMFSFGERQARILVAQTGVFRQNSNGTYQMGTPLPGLDFTQFPFTATPAFGVLSPDDNYSSVTLMIFGGAPVAGLQDNDVPAGRMVRSTTISWSRTGTSGPYTYKFSDWTSEDLGISRVMGDAIALPNGDVVVINGAQGGVAGDSSTSAGSGGRADYPAFWAQLYQPDLPLNNRVSTLAGSTIARMYHGVAVLTPNATVLVTGCDRCFRLRSDVPSYVSPGSRFEYRNEIFYPPYWFDVENKPRIVRVYGGKKQLPYDTTFSLQWVADKTGSPLPPVTSVTLVAPASTTHSFNMNQRTVKLKVLAVNYNTGTIVVKSPPHPYVAPPQWYMVFAMNGKVMSKAQWIKLVDTKGQGKVAPT